MGACEDRQVRSSRDVSSLETNTVQSHQGKKSMQQDDRGICRSAIGGLSPGTFFTKRKKNHLCDKKRELGFHLPQRKIETSKSS